MAAVLIENVGQLKAFEKSLEDSTPIAFYHSGADVEVGRLLEIDDLYVTTSTGPGNFVTTGKLLDRDPVLKRMNTPKKGKKPLFKKMGTAVVFSG